MSRSSGSVGEVGPPPGALPPGYSENGQDSPLQGEAQPAPPEPPADGPPPPPTDSPLHDEISDIINRAQDPSDAPADDSQTQEDAKGEATEDSGFTPDPQLMLAASEAGIDPTDVAGVSDNLELVAMISAAKKAKADETAEETVEKPAPFSFEDLTEAEYGALPEKLAAYRDHVDARLAEAEERFFQLASVAMQNAEKLEHQEQAQHQEVFQEADQLFDSFDNPLFGTSSEGLSDLQVSLRAAVFNDAAKGQPPNKVIDRLRQQAGKLNLSSPNNNQAATRQRSYGKKPAQAAPPPLDSGKGTALDNIRAAVRRRNQ